MTTAFIVQLVLIGFYFALTVMFSAKRETWPMALYYAGCIVKDAGVFILGWWVASKAGV